MGAPRCRLSATRPWCFGLGLGLLGIWLSAAPLALASGLDLPAAARPGSVLWTAPGVLTSDLFGRFYLAGTTQPAAADAFGTFSRIDPGTGQVLWRHTGLPSLDASGSCAVKSVVAVADVLGVTGLDTQTGAVLWRLTLPPVSDGKGAAMQIRLHCLEDGQTLLLHDPRRPFLAALQVTTGEQFWLYRSAVFNRIDAIDTEAITLSELGAGTVRLAVASGHVLWRDVADAGAMNLAAVIGNSAAHVFIANDRELRALDGRSGRRLWTIPLPGSGTRLTMHRGYLYLQAATSLTRVSPADGRVQWTYATDGAALQTLALADGRMLVFSLDRDAGGVTWALLNQDAGQVLWQRQFAGASVYPLEGEAGQLYARSRLTLHRIDMVSGTTTWTYRHDEVADLSAALGDVVAIDADQVYLSYRGPGYRYAAWSLLALDRRTGEVNWQHDEPGSAAFVLAKASYIFVRTGYDGSLVKALGKR